MSTGKARNGVDRRQFLKGATAGAVGLGFTGASLFAQDQDKGAARMRRRPLGRTGLEVSVVAFGCGGLLPDHLPLLQTAYDRGINLYDTAWGYGRGQSEVAVGKLCGVVKDRESFHIVTKASGWRPPAGSSKQVYEAFRDAVQESLKRLDTDYIDVFYWPHGASSPEATRNPAAREALLKLKEQKLIRHVGTSSHSNYASVAEAAIEEGFYEVLMPVLNICTQNAGDAGDAPSGRRRGRSIEDTRALLAAAKKKKVGIVGMKVANPGFLGSNVDTLLAQEFGDGSTLSRHQKLYAWMLNQEGVSAVVVGIRSARHLMEAVEVGCLA